MEFDRNDLDFLAYVKAKNLSESEIDNLIEDHKKDLFFKESKERFIKNMEAFQQYMPALYNKFAHFDEERHFKEKGYSLIYHKGAFNILLPDNTLLYGDTNAKDRVLEDVLSHIENGYFSQKRFYKNEDYIGQIHYRYINETAAILDENNKDGSFNIGTYNSIPFLFIAGVGLGYQIEHFYSNLELPNVFVVEPDEYMFYLSLFVTDYADLFSYLLSNGFTIKLKVGFKKEELLEDFALFARERGNFFIGFSNFYIDYETEQIRDLISYLNEKYQILDVGLGFFDDSLFGVSHGSHLLASNIPVFKKDRVLSNDLKECPIFIIGNGPSLDDDLAFIKKNQDKALILACGTALNTLYNEGVAVDFYAITERTEAIYDTLVMYKDTDFLNNVIMLGSNVVHPKIANLFKRKAIFAKRDEALSYLFGNENEESCILNIWDSVSLMNPLVSNYALSATLALGFNKIYLFGIDNGTKKEGVLHAKSSIYSKLKLSENINGTGDLYNSVEGNFGSMISSNTYYISSLSNLTESIRNNKKNRSDFEIINCSDGAKIEGTCGIHSYDLDFSLCKDLDKEYLKEKFLSDNCICLNISLDTIKEHIKPERFDYIISFIVSRLSKIHQSRVEYIVELNTVYSILSKVIDSKDRFYAEFLHGSFNNFSSQILAALYYKEDEFEAIVFANKIRDLVLYFLEDCRLLFRALPDFIMNEHKAFTNNKIGFDHPLSLAPDMPTVDLSTYFLKDKSKLERAEPFYKSYK